MITKRVFLFLLLGGVWPVLGWGQTLDVTPTSNQNEYQFDIKGVGPLVTPYTNSTLPFNWAFIIFGNGEYLPKMERTHTANNLPKFCWENYDFPGFRKNDTTLYYTYPSYVYTVNNNIVPLTFTALSLVMERKGDPPQPNIWLSKPVTPSPNSTAQRLQTVPNGKSIYLAHNAGYVNDRKDSKKSVFIISYKTSCMSGGGTVHLFYGTKRQGGHSPAAPSSYTPSDHLKAPIAHLPNYFSGSPTVVFSNPTTSSTSYFARHSTFTLPPAYISNAQTAIGLGNEQRLFEEVEYDKTANLYTDDWSYALAVLTSHDPCDSRPNLKLLEQLDGFNGVTLGGEYIVDIDTIYLKNGEPIDPNNIVVTQICDRDVTLKLKFCNLPNAPSAASSSTFDFSIIDPKFEWCRVKKIECPEGTPINWVDCQPLCWLPRSHPAVYDCSKHSITINKVLDKDQCAVAEIVLSLRQNAVIETWETNICSHIRFNPLIKANVILNPNPYALSVTNEPTASTSFPNILPCDDPPKPCEGFCFTFWHLISGILGSIAIGVGIWWRKRMPK